MSDLCDVTGEFSIADIVIDVSGFTLSEKQTHKVSCGWSY